MRREANASRLRSSGKSRFTQARASQARRARNRVLEQSGETARLRQTPARRVRRESGQLRHDQHGVLTTIDELLAQGVGGDGALGGAVVAVKMNERGNAFFGVKAVAARNEYDDRVIAVAQPGKRSLRQSKDEGRAERVGG